MTDPWYTEMGRRNLEERVALERAKLGPRRDVPPPDDGTCRECYEWRFDLTQSDGTDRWLWFLKCGAEWGLNGRPPCPHEHHKDEIWMATA